MATISRAFLEIGANTEGLQKGLEQAVKSAEQNGAKLSSAGRNMVLQFENALNPTRQLAIQIEALEKAGKSAGDIQAVLGDKIRYSTEQARAHGQPIEEIVGKYTRLSDTMGPLGRSMTDLGKNMSMYVTLPMVGAAGAALKLAGDFEQTKIAFDTMLGSGVEAQAFLEELEAFAASTPFEFRDLTDAAKRMMALGFEAGQMIPTLTAIGDSVAGLGGGAEMINRVTLALGQMQAKGKVSAQEMQQLAEAGIPAWQMLADKIGVSIPQAMKMAEKGMIQASVALPAILEGMNDRFGGLMARQSQTFSGQLSNLKDQLFFTMQDLGAALLPLAKDVMDNFIRPAVSGLQSLAEWFQGLSGPTKNAIIVIGGVVAAAGPLLAAIGSMTSGIAALIPMFPAIASGVTAVTAAMGPWGIALGAVAAALIIYRDEMAAGIRSTLEFLNVIDDLPEVVGKNQSAYRRIADELKVSTETLDRFAAGNKNAIAILGKHKDEIAELQARLKNHTITQEQYERELRKMIESQGSAARSTNTVRTSIVNIETETGKHKKGVKELTTAYDEWMKRHPDFTEFLNRQRQAEEALGNELIKNAELIDEEKRKREEALVPLEALTSGTKALDSAIIPLNSDIWKQVGATQEAAAKTHELGSTVSTTLTSMTQAIAEKVTQWAGPFQSFASGALSALMEGLFKPLIDQMTSVGNSIGNWLSGLLSGKGDGFSLGGILGSGKQGGGVPGAGNLLNVGNLKNAVGAVTGALGIGGTAAGIGGTATGAGLAGLTAGAGAAEAGMLAGMSGVSSTTGAAAGGGSFMGSMGALMTNPWTIGIGAAAGLGYLGYKWATGPDSYEAGSKEIMRDFGVSVSDSQVKELFKAVGIDDGDAWDYRKELLSSPAAMAAFLAAGKTPDMAKMANLQAYGSGHDFSGALQAAAGGDWKPYNDLYKQVFGGSGLFGRHLALESVLIPGYAQGTPYVPRDGLAYLHKGEAVIPAGENRPQVVVNITGPVYGLDDLDRRIAASIKRTWSLGGLSYLKA